jgi:hypothetical protein
MQKSLDRKLAEIRSNANSKAFIIADAKDADMAFGIRAPGRLRSLGRIIPDQFPSIQKFYDDMEELVRQADIDIMLTSVSAMDILAREKGLFQDSPVTPAVRVNDTTDIWQARGSSYAKQLSRPFATTTIEEAQYGTLLPPTSQLPDVNLGLYSVTFNNDLEADLLTLERFREFRIEATRKGFRYFLEVFNPNVVDCGLDPQTMPAYVNDQIARLLAGIPRASRPEFLKIAYNGPAAMEALVNYDSTLVVGILGGAASTTYDAFRLLADAKKHGARLALFGRRIKAAEHPLSFVKHLRSVADEKLSPEEAVEAYRGDLQKLNIPAARDSASDMNLTTPALL